MGIPYSVTSIGDWAFAFCESLTSITIPNGVTSIGEGAFFHCTSMTEITIPNSVTSIGYHAFAYCTSLTSITIPNSVTSIGHSLFMFCTSLTSITIPNSVTSIGIQAFVSCTSLTEITIPNSVTSIGDAAFWGCERLASVTFMGVTPPTFGDNVFEDTPELTTIYVPIGAKAAYEEVDELSGFNIVEAGKPPATVPEKIVSDAIKDGETVILDDDTGTIISQGIFGLIADSDEVVKFELPNGIVVSIAPATITDIPDEFDLNIEIEITSQGNQIPGVPVNSIVINPAAHGEFGFELSFTLPAETLTQQGLNGNNARLFYIDSDGKLVQGGRATRNSDGSITVTISKASSYVIRQIQLGNIKGSGELGGRPGIFDALEILKSIVGMSNDTKECDIALEAALIMPTRLQANTPNIFDALEILKFIVGMPSEVK